MVILNFSIDRNDEFYKLITHSLVVAEANGHVNQFIASSINDAETNFEAFAQAIFDETSYDTSNVVVHSLALYRSTIKTIKRSIEENNACGCSPIPFYFTGTTSFSCSEDLFVNVSDFIYSSPTNTYSGVDSLVYEFMQAASTSEVRFDALYDLRIDKAAYLTYLNDAYIYYEQNPTSQYTMPGSAWGCCGNYKGSCWTYHVFCLIHDMACVLCNHWYCTRYCVIA